jgi:hypothetical protein
LKSQFLNEVLKIEAALIDGALLWNRQIFDGPELLKSLVRKRRCNSWVLVLRKLIACSDQLTPQILWTWFSECPQ